MSTAAVMEIGSDLWNAGVYTSLAAASELAAELEKPKGEKQSVFDARRACELLDQLNGFLARGLTAADKSVPYPMGAPKEKLLAARDSLLNLHGICERLLSLSSDLNELEQMKSELELLRAQSERLLDLADWFDALSTPEEIDAKFKAAAIEFANGDVVSWDAVK